MISVTNRNLVPSNICTELTYSYNLQKEMVQEEKGNCAEGKTEEIVQQKEKGNGAERNDTTSKLRV